VIVHDLRNTRRHREFLFSFKRHSSRYYPVQGAAYRYIYNKYIGIYTAYGFVTKTTCIYLRDNETQCFYVDTYGYVKEKKCNPVPLCDQNVKNGKGIREHTHCNNDHNDDVVYRIIVNILIISHVNFIHMSYISTDYCYIITIVFSIEDDNYT